MQNTELSPILLSIIAFAPLLGSIITGFFGTGFVGNQINRRASHIISIALVAVSAVLSCYVLYLVAFQGAHYEGALYTWTWIGKTQIEIGYLIDPISAMMMAVVTSVSLMVHIYTIGYMADDVGYQRFYSYISLFTFSMLMLVMSNNMLQLFFGWEAVGLVSYLLIGFYFDRDSAVFANMKAFLMNRFGDFGFILGIGLLVAHIGSFNYNDVFANIDKLQGGVIPGTNWSLITASCICLFIGAMGKSAQVPLHAWLPDSMEGPTPISALIHAATMVTAGIFMVSRFSPLYELSNTALSFIIIIGAIGALFLGILGIIQDDIKRVIAYSTLSQLGYMTVALGASAYNAAVFHLMTHAFFKALLFLGAGSVILGMHHNQDIRTMGGLRKYMPITWITFLLGTLALVGTPFFSGFYSKEHIIEAVHASNVFGAGFAYYATLIGVFITSLYSFRVYFLVFHGKERFEAHDDHHHTHDDHSHGHHGGKPHESPWVVTLPLVLLAIPSVIIGALTIEPMLFGDFLSKSITIHADAHPAMHEIAEEYHGWVAYAIHSLTSLPLWLAILGFVVAWYCYLINTALPAKIYRFFAPINYVLENKYFADWFNIEVVARGGRKLGSFLWRFIDKGLIDGVLVMGSSHVVRGIAAVSRYLQSGYIYHYAFAMIIGVIVLISFFVLVP
ncbi:NADH-quinone oxidoreductase subunit L [Brackiella oedipodis]|uniref:NADH-quinone oxidoreductase subunit L n=1 Tax=Brackiella oedipodis TaxID=124225 RepID=UPI0005700412|nr:NADH-quinone oxidoreductase subunit L [Brackiella oedipodis]